MSEGWSLVPLGELLTERRETPSAAALASGEIRIIAKIGFNDGKIQLRAGSETKTGMILAQPGDLVVSGINAAKGAVAIYGAENTAPVAATIHYSAYLPDAERVDVSFLWWLLRSNTFRDLLQRYVPGGIKTELKAKRLLSVPVPVPLLPEQKRIVTRIEELAGKIERARELRQKADEECGTLFQLVMKQGFEMLTGVEYAPIKTFADVRGGIQKGPHRTPGANPVRYLTVAHVQRNQILIDDPRYFEVSPEELSRWRLEFGDVLIIEGNGSADQIGRTAIFRGEIGGCVHQNHVIRIRPDRNVIEPEFLNAYINSTDGQKEIQSRSRTTSGLRTLSVGRIKEICVPVPSLLEQRKMLTFQKEIDIMADVLNTLQRKTQAELDALLPSILDRAFRGEL